MVNIVIDATLENALTSAQVLQGKSNFYHNALASLGFANNSQAPIADWLRMCHGLSEQYVVATPIHWQASHNNAMIVACGSQLGLGEDKSHELFERFASFAAEANLRTYYHDANTWLLQCDNKPPLTSPSPYLMVHHPITLHLRAMDDSLYWQRWITELQMLFSSPAAEEVMNGVWLWGSGKVQEYSAKKPPILVNSERLFDLAKILSAHVAYYSVEKLTSRTVVWVESLSSVELESMRTATSAYAVNWYWNNQAYHTQAKRWFSRFIPSKKAKS